MGNVREVWGFVADTHGDENNALPYILKDMRENRGVTHLFHLGDIHKKHLTLEYRAAHFRGFQKIYCALVDDQVGDPFFNEDDFPGWKFTRPGKDRNRIVKVGDIKVYVGHMRASDFWYGKEFELVNLVEKERKENDGLRVYGSGHTHRACLLQTGLVDFINPGAVCGSLGTGCEYAVMDPATNEIVFCRILLNKPAIETFSVGIISDSRDVSLQDPTLLPRLADQLRKRDVKTIIHLGPVAFSDIGHPAFAGFDKVYFGLHKEQKGNVPKVPKWEQIDREEPVITINGYRFLVQSSLGHDIADQSERTIAYNAEGLNQAHFDIKYVLCGNTQLAFYEEAFNVKVINPGSVLNGGNYVVLCLPREEITFGDVPPIPLPPLK